MTFKESGSGLKFPKHNKIQVKYYYDNIKTTNPTKNKTFQDNFPLKEHKIPVYCQTILISNTFATKEEFCKHASRKRKNLFT